MNRRFEARGGEAVGVEARGGEAELVGAYELGDALECLEVGVGAVGFEPRREREAAQRHLTGGGDAIF